MATHTHTPSDTRRRGTAPSRRELLGAGGFTALAGIATMAFAKPEILASCDAELSCIGITTRSLLDQRAPLDRQWWAAPSTRKRGPSPELAELERIADAMAPIDTALDDLVDRATGLRGAHPNSLQAKALLIQHQLRTEQADNEGRDLPREFHLIWSLCEDLTGEAL